MTTSIRPKLPLKRVELSCSGILKVLESQACVKCLTNEEISALNELREQLSNAWLMVKAREYVRSQQMERDDFLRSVGIDPSAFSDRNTD